MVRRRWMLTGLVPLLAAAVVLGLRLERVHQDTWEWRLTYSSTPPKLHVFGRDYRRADSPSTPPAGTTYVATAPGGARVYSHRVGRDVPTVIWAATPAGTTSYSLMGGP